MNLALVLVIAVILLLSFSIGLNLGLHGIMSSGTEDRRAPADRSKYAVQGSNIDNSQQNTASTPPKLFQGSGAMTPLAPLATQSRHELTQKSSEAPNDAEGPVVSPKKEVTEPPKESVKESSGVPEATASQSLAQKTALAALKDIYSGEAFQAVLSKAAEKVGGGGAATNNADAHSGIESFLKSGGKIPIVLLTCNRAEQLKNTLNSLLAVRGVKKENIIISQDGAMREIKDVASSFGIKIIQNTEGLRLRGGAAVDGAERIAKHYKYSLTNAFDTFSSPPAPAVIIVEDDLLFSPDFYEYLSSTAPILEKDPSTFVVSAWNDNGFKGKVRDPYTLKRSEYFPGLGWLLPRALYKNELEARWPNAHWDHWLRSPEIHGTREIVYPEVPRTFHNGIVGTFMNLDTHNKYFKDINYNLDVNVGWDVTTGKRKLSTSFFSGGGGGDKDKDAKALVPLSDAQPNYLTAMNSVYEARMDALMTHCTHLKTTHELSSATGIVCMWIDIDPFEVPGNPPPFTSISTVFGLWHEHRRGAHRGVHEFHWEDKYILIINIREVPGEFNYRSKKPPEVQPLNPHSFDSSILMEPKRLKMGLEGTPADESGLDCNRVCSSRGLSCKEHLLAMLNTCQALQEKFPCRDCGVSFGLEQPAFVNPLAEASMGPGKCLISSDPSRSTCGASHPSTMRLCACA